MTKKHENQGAELTLVQISSLFGGSCDLFSYPVAKTYVVSTRTTVSLREFF